MGATENQDRELVLIFFSLGHKFVPRSKYTDRVPLKLLEELRETQRKVVWQDVIGDTVFVGGEYVRYRKGTMPEEGLMRRQDRVFNEICCSQAHCIALNQEWHAQEHSASFWRQTLGRLVQGGRFLACDKNLGVKFVELGMYKRLANEQLQNYETAHLYPEEHKKSYIDSIMNGMVERVKEIAIIAAGAASAIVVEKKRGKITLLEAGEIKCLEQLSKYLMQSVAGKESNFKIPHLRMLLKVHKVVKEGALCPTRPIVPNCGLPNYGMGKWVGSFMAKMARQIPWNLESTKQFQLWLTDRSRGPRVRTYDFTNLYGNEPVTETLALFARALEEMKWVFDDPVLHVTMEAMLRIVRVPDGLQPLIGNRARLIVVIVAELVQQTIAQLDLGDDIVTVTTSKFLAMGCPPVAPLSIITLGYLEREKIGPDRCTRGMRRLIDDIVVDLDVISEIELRSIYPRYLTLNNAEIDHFLDVAFTWNGEKFLTWPYIKLHATIPLNFMSQHPPHTLRAAAKNELNRLLGLTNMSSVTDAWVEFWWTKYSLAGYTAELLGRILREVIVDVPTKRADRERGVNHVETWRGVKTSSAKLIAKSANRACSTAWSVEPTLMSMALKAHLK